MKLSNEQLRKLLQTFLIPLFAILLLTFVLMVVLGNPEKSTWLTFVGGGLLLLGLSIKIIRTKLKKEEK